MKREIINLGMHPFADTFISKDRLNESEPVYPLKVILDDESGTICLDCPVKQDRYNLYDYSYTSSNSEFSCKHWRDFAREVSDKIGLKEKANIIEIGSNDGFLCKEFMDRGHNVIGVDASYEMIELSMKERDVNSICFDFDYGVSSYIIQWFGKYDLVVANNVFNHADDPLDFAKGVVNLLSDDGVFVFELPYWKNTIVNYRFDQIYHEHRTYFTVKYAFWLLKEVGLEIIDLEEVDYHGGSLRIYARKQKGIIEKWGKVSKMIAEEEQLRLFDVEIYSKYMKAIKDRRADVITFIHQFGLIKIPCVGIGAAAKGNTLLNFYGLDNTMIDCVTDSSPLKQGKYTPLSRIPIVADEELAKYDKVIALMLSWNISDQIKENLKKINPQIKFL